MEKKTLNSTLENLIQENPEKAMNSVVASAIAEKAKADAESKKRQVMRWLDDISELKTNALNHVRKSRMIESAHLGYLKAIDSAEKQFEKTGNFEAFKLVRDGARKTRDNQLSEAEIKYRFI